MNPILGVNTKYEVLYLGYQSILNILLDEITEKYLK